MSTNVALILTDKASKVVIDQYDQINETLESDGSQCYLLYHVKDTKDTPSDFFRGLRCSFFSSDILNTLGYRPVGAELVPGNNHFPLLQFYLQNPGYDYYWVIEDDVRFSGDWKTFFSLHQKSEEDFISCHIRDWDEDPHWPWWSIQHPKIKIPLQKRVASFNPIYRLSNRAVEFIHESLKDGWSGHHEVVLPTLLKNTDASIADFGGHGRYVPNECKDQLYVGKSNRSKGIIDLDDTMRWRPVFNAVGTKRNCLYHPVKDFDLEPECFSKTSERRREWLDYMDRLVKPVIWNLAQDTLKENMSVDLAKCTDHPVFRKAVSYLEAFARTLSGIAPWLNIEGGDEKEVELREAYRYQVLQAIKNAVSPQSKDYMPCKGGQSLVDASYLALSFIRCPWLWHNLSLEVQGHVISLLNVTRKIVPVYTNWILFSGMIETFFYKFKQDFDPLRIEYCFREFGEHWYVGDGMFSDGMNFHVDYYNSIVIHPFLANMMDVLLFQTKLYDWFWPKLTRINERYAELQERMINVDGTFPVTGRSMVYRAGVFHHLADMALRKKLPKSLKPAQVREALTATIRKTFESPNTFNEGGWLNIGLAGSQPGLADFYITTGSLYMCTNVFLPLGLSCSDPFWVNPDEPWTASRAWRGEDVARDLSLDIRSK